MGRRLIMVVAVLAALIAFAPHGVDAKTPTCHGMKATAVAGDDETLAFTAGNDVFVGSAGDNSFTGGDEGGVDYVCGNGGNDFIELSGAGSKAYGGSGNDEIHVADGAAGYGEGGYDFVTAEGEGSLASGGSGGDEVYASDGAVADGGSGDDYVYGDGAYALYGGAGNDYVDSFETEHLIDCGANDDYLNLDDRDLGVNAQEEDGPRIKRCEENEIPT